MRNRSSSSRTPLIEPLILTVPCASWSGAQVPVSTAVGSAYWLLRLVPYANPGMVATSPQSMPVVPPLTHAPPSEMGFSVAEKLVE